MSKYNEIKAALLGAGTVGGGVYKLIEKRKSEMPSKVQAELTITKVLVKNQNKKNNITKNNINQSKEIVFSKKSVFVIL